MKEIGISETRRYLKPSLTNAQKLARLKFVLKLVENVGHGVYGFKEHNMINVDEKWIYVAKLSGRIKTLPGQEPPKSQQVQHKSHIPKLMILSPIGSPRMLDAKNLIPAKG